MAKHDDDDVVDDDDAGMDHGKSARWLCYLVRPCLEKGRFVVG